MKKSFVSALTVLCAVCFGNLVCIANENVSDLCDTVVVHSANKVVVISTSTCQKVEIDGSAENPEYHFSSSLNASDSVNTYSSVNTYERFTLDFPWEHKDKYRHGRRFRFSMLDHVNFGIIGLYDQPSAMHGDFGPGWETGINIFMLKFYPWRNSHQFSFGLDVRWANFRMSQKSRYSWNDGLYLDSYPANANPKYSSLSMDSFCVPFNYSVNIAPKVLFFLGPEISFNIDSRIKTKYYLDDHKVKDKFKHAHVEPVTFNLQLGLTFHHFGFYAKWSPLEVIQGDYCIGGNFRFWSVGVVYR